MDSYKKQLTEMNMRLSRLEGQYSALLQRKDEIISTVSLAKARLSLHEEMSQAIDQLQKKTLQRSVGRFEALLTAIFTDIMPGEGTIKLFPSIKNNNPSLDLFILKPNGKLEDVYDGNGGAATNIVGMGARFIALHRSRNRKFILLDESDCWVEEGRIPAFSKVVHDVALNANTQTLFVTHHPTKLLNPNINCVRLYIDHEDPLFLKNRETGDMEHVANVKVETIRAQQWESPEQIGIRGLKLEGFRKHWNVTIPMYPGATVYQGKNNIGKSAALHGALSAIAYNDATDNVIHHNAKEAKITAFIENNKSIVWSRMIGRNPVVKYSLYDGDVLVMTDAPDKSGKPPAWVSDLLGIKLIEDIDVQLSHQKKPVFLLDQPGSARAKMLSLGKESTYLHMLMKAYNNSRSQDRDIVKNGEAELDKIEKSLKQMENLHQLTFDVLDLHEAVDEQEKKQSETQIMGQHCRNIEQIALKIDVLTEILGRVDHINTPVMMDNRDLARIVEQFEKAQAVIDALTHVNEIASINVPTLTDTREIVAVIAEFSRLKSLVDTKFDIELVGTPEMKNTQELHSVIDRLQKAAGIIQTISENSAITTSVELPKMVPAHEVKETINKMIQYAEHIQQAQKQLAEAEIEHETAKTEVDSLLREAGRCPVCDSDTSHHTH